MKRQLFPIVTDTSGAATVGQSTTTALPSVIGELYAIKYVPGTIDTGATVTVTCVAGDGSAKPLLTPQGRRISGSIPVIWFTR